jgi:hypothetical protein
MVNVLSSAFSLFTGNSDIIFKITCGKLGKKDSKARYTWVFPFAMQLGANAAIAAIIRGTPGYRQSFTIIELVLLYLARPRLSWLVLGLTHSCIGTRTTVSNWRRRLSSTEDDDSDMELRVEPFHNAAWIQERRIRGNSDRTGAFNFSDAINPLSIYSSSYKSQLIAETMLLLLSTYTMGRLAHFATTNKYFASSAPIPQSAKFMYGGALFFVIWSSLTFSIASVVVWQLLFPATQSRSLNVSLMTMYLGLWIGSWLFWAGFVRLAGEL